MQPARTDALQGSGRANAKTRPFDFSASVPMGCSFRELWFSVSRKTEQGKHQVSYTVEF